jgi:microsomal dipeptidase-like Zn-dependent dipeptidase
MLRLKREGKKALVLGLENGYAIGKEISRLEVLKQMGVAYITLCHNGANDICDSAAGTPEWNGLSPFGKEVVREMNRLGIVIDVSHAAESTFYDVLRESRTPVIASHSSARALCDHPRNLTDDQIRALAAKGGVVHICLYAGFLRQGAGMGEASLSDAIRHINHVANLVGTDHLGIGSDFDGGGDLIGCRASNELIQLTTRLLREGYSETDIRKIWGANLLRVMEAVQSAV